MELWASLTAGWDMAWGAYRRKAFRSETPTNTDLRGGHDGAVVDEKWEEIYKVARFGYT